MINELKKKAKALLKSLTYSEMEEDELALVVEYETEKLKPKIDAMKNEGVPPDKIDDRIHDWWLDYRIADGTEDALSAYANQ